MRWIGLIVLLTACASLQPPAVTNVVDSPEAFLQSHVGQWEARWRFERLEVEGVLAKDTLWLLRASAPDLSQTLPHNHAADTLLQFWISDGSLMARNPGFAHDNATELCYTSVNEWAPCLLPPSGFRTKFFSGDSIHIGEPEAPRAVLRRVGPGRVF